MCSPLFGLWERPDPRHSVPKWTERKLPSFQHPYPQLQSKAYNVPGLHTETTTQHTSPLPGTSRGSLAERCPDQLPQKLPAEVDFEAYAHVCVRPGSTNLPQVTWPSLLRKSLADWHWLEESDGFYLSPAAAKQKCTPSDAELFGLRVPWPPPPTPTQDRCVEAYIKLAEAAIEQGLLRWPALPKMHVACLIYSRSMPFAKGPAVSFSARVACVKKKSIRTQVSSQRGLLP